MDRQTDKRQEKERRDFVYTIGGRRDASQRKKQQRQKVNESQTTKLVKKEAKTLREGHTFLNKSVQPTATAPHRVQVGAVNISFSNEHGRPEIFKGRN